MIEIIAFSFISISIAMFVVIGRKIKKIDDDIRCLTNRINEEVLDRRNNTARIQDWIDEHDH